MIVREYTMTERRHITTTMYHGGEGAASVLTDAHLTDWPFLAWPRLVRWCRPPTDDRTRAASGRGSKEKHTETLRRKRELSCGGYWRQHSSVSLMLYIGYITRQGRRTGGEKSVISGAVCVFHSPPVPIGLFTVRTGEEDLSLVAVGGRVNAGGSKEGRKQGVDSRKFLLFIVGG
ncbi:hypothetical protein R1sor_002895 [Riccia sorocarpa]|uniref:Uncharacterized protein n=1 Tax=Riccia sorocarpa TaxID=122646 RepID=A0ABD3H021_9MARC